MEVREGEGYHTIELFQSGAKRFLWATKEGNAHRRRQKGVDAEQSHENGLVERSNELENVGGANWSKYVEWKGKRGRNWLQTGESIYGVDT